MIIARIESLILERGMDDAIRRAEAYIEAGADGIMIHSRQKPPDEVFEFCRLFDKLPTRVPLVAVPTSYHQVTEPELADRGVNMVIYANHLLRAAYPQMVKVATDDPRARAGARGGPDLAPIKDALAIIPENHG